MARHRRIRFSGFPQHIIQRGVDRQACFSEESDYRLYLGLLQELAPLAGCEVHAYTLMKNHVHLLVTGRLEGACSLMMKLLGQRYAQAINKRWKRTGPLWEGRYKSSLVESTAYSLACQRYIEFNPVRARMVRRPADYRWSSYRANALGEASPLLTPSADYLKLGSDGVSRRLAYRALCGEPQSEAHVEAIRKAIRGGYVYGSPAFIEHMAQVFGRRMTQRNRVPDDA